MPIAPNVMTAYLFFRESPDLEMSSSDLKPLFPDLNSTGISNILQVLTARHVIMRVGYAPSISPTAFTKGPRLIRSYKFNPAAPPITGDPGSRFHVEPDIPVVQDVDGYRRIIRFGKGSNERNSGSGQGCVAKGGKGSSAAAMMIGEGG